MAIEEKQGSLHGKVGRAGVWVAIRQVSVRGLAILQLLVLARILAPEDFGLFAIAMMVYAFIEAMTFLGFGHALIQKKTVAAEDLNTLFVVNVVRGLLLALLVWAASYPVAMLMNSPASQPLITIIGLLPLIMGFHNPAMILFQKELRMKQELSFYLAGAFANLGVSLWFAMRGAGAWALIWGLLAQSMAQLVISYLIQKYRPKFQFAKASFAEMFHFGKWLLASQGLKYFSNNLPSWVIGSYLGTHALGLYHVAGRFSQAIGNEFAALISTVAFPAFSKLQSDTNRLADAYLRSQKIVLSASFMLFGTMIALAEPFVVVFLGEKWHGTENLIVLLSLVGLVQSIGAQAEIMKALDQPIVIAKFSLARLLLVAILIVPLIHAYGAEGAVSAVLIPTVVLLPFAMIIILRNLSISMRGFAKISIPLLIPFCGIIVVASVFSELMHGFTGFLVSLIFSIMVYLSLLVAADYFARTGILKEWKLLWAKLANKTFVSIT